MASDDNEHHNNATLASLKKGDLVEFKRGLYSHWGVYIGQGEIVHLTSVGKANESDESKNLFTIDGKLYKEAKVCKDQFRHVVGNGKAFKNNVNDHISTPLDPEQIVENARSQIDEVGYNIITHNCEHFAKWCRYGIQISDQVTTAGGVIVFGICCCCRWKMRQCNCNIL